MDVVENTALIKFPVAKYQWLSNFRIGEFWGIEEYEKAMEDGDEKAIAALKKREEVLSFSEIVDNSHHGLEAVGSIIAISPIDPTVEKQKYEAYRELHKMLTKKFRKRIKDPSYYEYHGSLCGDEFYYFYLGHLIEDILKEYGWEVYRRMERMCRAWAKKHDT